MKAANDFALGWAGMFTLICVIVVVAGNFFCPMF